MIYSSINFINAIKYYIKLHPFKISVAFVKIKLSKIIIALEIQNELLFLNSVQFSRNVNK